ncbi:MAG TPA: peptidoglycan editing factor PgeF [Streptosporangiaceae bacterium]|nr:peptidoglycan editing factor PgeF [Streptosporangiaceae bacterium]
MTPANATMDAGLGQRAGLPVLAWPVFEPLPADAVVTTRRGGVSAGRYATLNLSFSVGDEAANVRENRGRVAAALGTGLATFVFARQVHGSHAQVVSAADRGRGTLAAGDAVGPADALVTGEPGVALAILVADCVPIVLYDPAAHVLACVHAGWRGTVAHVTKAALAAMGSLGSDPRRVIAGIGPAIGPACYQVGDEVARAVRDAFGQRAQELLRPDAPGGPTSASRWRLDLPAANRHALNAAGVPDSQIYVAATPTGPGPGLFFSHRAERPCGRFALVARLESRGQR